MVVFAYNRLVEYNKEKTGRQRSTHRNTLGDVRSNQKLAEITRSGTRTVVQMPLGGRLSKKTTKS